MKFTLQHCAMYANKNHTESMSCMPLMVMHQERINDTLVCRSILQLY